MIGIISDVHGNHEALTRVLVALDRLGVTEIVCLGDIAGYYCQVNECCDEIRGRGIPSLMGNHDWYLVSGADCPHSRSANACLDYQRRVVSDRNRAWLAGLAPSATLANLSIVHAGWSDPLEERFAPGDDYFSLLPGNLFASGHSHVQFVWRGTTALYCNPGSVGQPRDGDARAAFAVLDRGEFSLYRVQYDVGAVELAMSDAGFEERFAANLRTGSRIGGMFSERPRGDNVFFEPISIDD